MDTPSPNCSSSFMKLSGTLVHCMPLMLIASEGVAKCFLLSELRSKAESLTQPSNVNCDNRCMLCKTSASILNSSLELDRSKTLRASVPLTSLVFSALSSFWPMESSVSRDIWLSASPRVTMELSVRSRVSKLALTSTRAARVTFTMEQALRKRCLRLDSPLKA